MLIFWLFEYLFQYIGPGAHIRNKFGGVSYVLGPTFVVFVFGKKSQLFN
jgi:hypothetical protein